MKLRKNVRNAEWNIRCIVFSPHLLSYSKGTVSTAQTIMKGLHAIIA